MPSAIDVARQAVVDQAWEWRAQTADAPLPRNRQLRDLALAVDALRDARSRAAIEAVRARAAEEPRELPTAWARVLDPAI